MQYVTKVIARDVLTMSFYVAHLILGEKSLVMIITCIMLTMYLFIASLGVISVYFGLKVVNVCVGLVLYAQPARKTRKAS